MYTPVFFYKNKKMDERERKNTKFAPIIGQFKDNNVKSWRMKKGQGVNH